MKIDFLCERCQSHLRLPIEHLGKQARCPVCGEVTLVQAPDVPRSLASTPTPDPPADGASSPWRQTGETERANPDGVDFTKPPQTGGLTNPYGPSVSSGLPGSPYASERGAGPNGGFEQYPAANPYAPVQTVYIDSKSVDGLWVCSLILGILSIFLPCTCSCIGAMLGIFLSSGGLVAGLFSASQPKWVVYLINLVGLLWCSLIIGLALLAVALN